MVKGMGLMTWSCVNAAMGNQALWSPASGDAKGDTFLGRQFGVTYRSYKCLQPSV